jgi:N-carbamoylputrescine amidase
MIVAPPSFPTVTLGLIQGRGFPEAEDSWSWHEDRIRDAAGRGAQVIVLQELFLTPYFCRSEDPAWFDAAEPVPGPSTKRLSRLAKELGVVIVASLFERRAAGLYHNTAAVIDADGKYLGKYRKTHIPEDPGFHEKFYFTPGDLPYRSWSTRFGRIGVLICWDQWYPEAARLAALNGAEILVYPTAIGWLPEEKAELGAAQHRAWETVQRGHAVANGCYVAAVNRTGVEGDTEFWGQSFVADPYGTVVARASVDTEETLLVPCKMECLEAFRRIWPFFRDRRIETYGGLTSRYLDEEGQR